MAGTSWQNEFPAEKWTFWACGSIFVSPALAQWCTWTNFDRFETGNRLVTSIVSVVNEFPVWKDVENRTEQFLLLLMDAISNSVFVENWTESFRCKRLNEHSPGGIANKVASRIAVSPKSLTAVRSKVRKVSWRLIISPFLRVMYLSRPNLWSEESSPPSWYRIFCSECILESPHCRTTIICKPRMKHDRLLRLLYSLFSTTT